jgi:chromosome partitioning protein
MKTIAVINQKGGCGKTTVSINLASALAELGHKTLLVDMDPQSHCAVGLAVPEDQIEQSIYDCLISTSRNEPIKLAEILWQISDKLELAPASLDLSAFEQQMAGIAERESCLKDVLQEVKGEYEYTIVDCPPAVGLLTFNALRAATDAIVPVETGYFALHGLSKQLETLGILCKRCSQQIEVKVLASMYDLRTKMAREILAELRSHFADKMFKTVINFNTKIKEASSFGQPICEYDPASKGQRDFRALAEEIIDPFRAESVKSSVSTKQRAEVVRSLSSQLETISATADELLQSTKPAAKASPVVNLPVVSIPALNSPVVSPADESPIEIVDEPEVSEEAAPKSLQAEKPQQTHASAKRSEARPAKPNVRKPIDTDIKLSDYYGVSQINDAVIFVTLYPRAHSVQIAGDFNNWQPSKTPLKKIGSSGVWQTKIKLPSGKYRYRLVVDGQWQQDPYNEATELNPFGGFNSVVEVK